MKGFTIYKSLTYLALLTLLVGCSSAGTTSRSNGEPPSAFVPENSFSVPGQLTASDLVYSVLLHRSGNRQSAPIIELDTNQTLLLSFDLLERDSRQLKVTFTHHNPDWTRSGLDQSFYQDGFLNQNLDFGNVSNSQHPGFRNYQFEFPNRDVSFLVSGNYMLRVEDVDTGNFLFSMPFFVTENEGAISSSVDTRTTPRSEDMRTAHYPRSTFELPDFVDTPQFDLEFYYVQNQFWGRNREAQELDTSAPGEVLFEMRQESPFVGDYEFQFLSLNNLSLQAPQIADYDPTTIPPKVVLFEDAQGFSSDLSRLSGRQFGNPSQNLSAQYADVHFTFDPAQNYSPQTEIYLVGDFNNWSIQSNYGLSYNEQTNRWTTNGIIKEGTYSYKYVLMQNNRIVDLALDDTFTRTEQEYHAFVYFRDPDRFYYRLLQINQFFGRS
ncbi:MAG: type IX secretion system plug protein domain-containing protein [Balneolaceae bacterium]